MNKKNNQARIAVHPEKGVSLGQVLALPSLPRIAYQEAVPTLHLTGPADNNFLEKKTQERIMQKLGNTLMETLHKYALKHDMSEFLIRLQGTTDIEDLTKSRRFRLDVDIHPVPKETVMQISQQAILASVVARDLNNILAFILEYFPAQVQEFKDKLPEDKKEQFNPLDLIISILISALPEETQKEILQKTTEIEAEEKVESPQTQ